MKKLIVMILALAVLTLAGCSGGDDEARPPSPEEIMASVYDEMDTALRPGSAYDDLTAFLDEWTAGNGIDSQKYDNGYYVITSGATDGHEDLKDIMLECSVGDPLSDEDIEKLAFVLYQAGLSAEHPDIKAVICSEAAEKKLPKELLSADRIINVSYGEKLALVGASPACSLYNVSRDISWTAPGYTTAYTVSINGLAGSEIRDITANEQNPIKVLAGILANWKASGYLYELAAFEGGLSPDRHPSYASFTITIPDSDAEDFEKRVEKRKAKLDKKVSGDNPEYSFIVHRSATPERVLDEASSSDLVSLLYIMDDGLREDEELHALTNLGSIRTDDRRASVLVKNFSMDADLLADMDAEVESLAGISSFRARKTGKSPLWQPAEDNILRDDLLSAKKADVLEEVSICPLIAEKAPEAECISMHICADQWRKGYKMMLGIMDPDQS